MTRHQPPMDPIFKVGTAPDGHEKRDRIRVDFSTLALLMKDSLSCYAGVLDISGRGARMRLEFAGNHQVNAFGVGDELTVLIHGFYPIPSKIVRSSGEDVAVEFMIDEQIEDTVIAQIMIAVNKLEGDIPVAEIPKSLPDAIAR